MIPSFIGEGAAAAEDIQKSIAIFAYKHWVYNLDMKTKITNHVQRIAFQKSKFQYFKNFTRKRELRAESWELRAESWQLTARAESWEPN